MPRELRQRGHQAELGTITQPLVIGRVHAPLVLHERIDDYCRTTHGFRRDKVLRLLEAGLDANDNKPEVDALFDRMRRLRITIKQANEIDLIPHPPPPMVDPSWWQEKEAERLDNAREEILRVLHEVGRILGDGA